MPQGGQGRPHRGVWNCDQRLRWQEEDGECRSMSGGLRSCGYRTPLRSSEGGGVGWELTDWTLVLGEGPPERTGEKSTDA